MENGWNIVVETTNGVVALWTNMFGTSLKLFYPLGVEISDQMIMETLNVKRAKPVASKEGGKRLWAEYYSDKLEDCGRVWVDHQSLHSNSPMLYTVADQQLKQHDCGYNLSNTIWTVDCNFCSKEQPEAPNCKIENIQVYKDRFIQLLIKIAKIVGDIKAINIDSGLVLYTPDMLTQKGCKLKEWVEDAKVYYYTKNDDCEIVLKSGKNRMVPWISVLRYPATNALTAESIIELLESLDNSNCSFNPLPMLKYIGDKKEMYEDWG